MLRYSATERKVIGLFRIGTKFDFEGHNYEVLICDKPRPSDGECKTDVYIKAKDTADRTIREIKVSIKQSNADFLENKTTIDRAKEIFGPDAQEIIKKQIEDIKDDFIEEPIIFFNAGRHTENHSIKQGWKYELLNKAGGKRSAKLTLTTAQKIEVYAGIGMCKAKADSMVGAVVVPNSGIANYFLLCNRDYANATDCASAFEFIDEKFVADKEIYYVCKAQNYRVDAGKDDGNRPFSVNVKWSLDNNKVYATLDFSQPLCVRGDAVEADIVSILNQLHISKKNFDDIKQYLSDSIKTYE